MGDEGKLNILYLAHDLSDAAVKKRVRMLLEGGADVTVAGFRRTAEPATFIAGCRAVDFGRTYNAGFIRRIGAVLREALLLRRRQKLFADADIVIARNLEMLAIGVCGGSLCRPKPKLVYECLDIHRLLLGNGFASDLLRKFEVWCAKRASLLITSSPAFVSHYFERRSGIRLPVRLVENKVLLSGAIAAAPVPRPPGPVWKIGWFGAIRCRKSLLILTELVRSSSGNIEVIIRGKLAEDQLGDFDSQIAGVPGIRFLGPYANPADLAKIYGEVHFTWAIDMFEEGLNSSWLLPNRIYEGGLYASVPIALQEVETGVFLKRLGIGVILPQQLATSLTGFFQVLDAAQYRRLEEAARDIPHSTWAFRKEDSLDLVRYLSALDEAHHG